MSRLPLLTQVFALLVAALMIRPIAAKEATPAASPTVAHRIEGLFDVGNGRSLYIRCRGAEGPTVIVISGGDDDSTSWRQFQRDADEFVRVCIYDRAGLGKSAVALAGPGRSPGDVPPGSRSVKDAVADLHSLLASAAVPGPFVLVAHSLGGIIARQFIIAHPEQVAGLVLVDANPPGFVADAPAQFRAFFEGDNFEKIYWAAGAQEISSGSPFDVPVAVLVAELTAAGAPEEQQRWQEAQAEQAEEFGVELVTVTGSGHRIQEQEPSAIVEAVRQIVETIRGESATPAAVTPGA